MGWRPRHGRHPRARNAWRLWRARRVAAGEVDDDFARESLIAPRARRLRTALRDAPADKATGDEGAIPAVRLPSLKLGRKEAVVALLLLAGLLSWLLDPALPGAVLASLLGTPTFAQDAPVATSGPLAPYDGWRIAYAGEDGRLYVITQDGFITLVGPQLPGLLPGGAFVASASPDGHHIAYASSASGINLIDLTGALAKPVVHAFPTVGTPLYWSPDSTRIALTTATGQIAILNTIGDRLSVLPAHDTPASLLQLGEVKLLGWIDSAHLLVATLDPRQGVARLSVVATSTGVARTLATLPIGAALPGFALSPDGGKILAYANSHAGAPSAAWLIDTATGSVQAQPGIAQGLDGPVVAAVWNGNSDTLVAATLFEPSPLQSTSEPPIVHTWTLDTSEDYDALQHDYGIPLGWTPENGPLIYGIWSAAEGGTDSYVLLRAYTLTYRGVVAIVSISRLVGAAGNLTFIGFVRTR